MSGIAGVSTSGGASGAVLARMMAATAHRAIHGASHVLCGDAALGHQLLDAAGSGPAMGTLVQSDDCIVTADCRLDNREELAQALGSGAEAGDTELILAAYRRWGLDAPNRLLGDFAFAIWDKARDRLLCVRDHFGVKPFYYHHSARGFAFASELDGVLASGWPERALNDDFVVAHLAGLAPRAPETLYRDVARLPPGHLAVTQGGRLEMRPYWRLEPIDLGGEDAAEGLRRRLQTAVEARMRGAAEVGAMLSGGLDSSAVSCLAAAIRGRGTAGPLPTFSMVFDETPEQNERPYIEEVLQVIEAAPHFLPSNNVAHLAELPEILRHQNGPFSAPNMAASRRLYAAARDAGVAVLLDGHGGDEVISHGSAFISELAARGRWRQVWRRLGQLETNEGWQARKLFWNFLGTYSPAAPLFRVWRKLSAKLASPPSPGPQRFLSPSCVARAAALEREAQRPRPSQGANAQDIHLATVTGPRQAYGLEIIDKAAARAGIEPRYPFWDKRVVEFCVSVASHEKLRDGRTRALLRRSLLGVLPEAVRIRPDKFDFMSHFVAGLTAPPAPAALDLFPDEPPGLAAFVALAELRAAYDRLLADPESLSPPEVQALWRCAAFAGWWRCNSRDISAREGC